MKNKLGNIATINFGLHKRGAQHGSVMYLHAGHFDDSLQPTKFADSFIELDEKEERFLLQPNDVILTGKGSRLFAWSYDPAFGKVVPSSLFYIIQTKPDLINNQYLAYYLNTERVQHQLLTIGAGATITSIPKKELQEIKIPIPPLAQQHKIVEVLETVEKTIQITTNILEEKKKLKRGLLNEMIDKY